MHLKLKTLQEIDRAIDFLHEERRRKVRIRWTIGVVTEQTSFLPRGFGVLSHGFFPKESDLMFVLTDSQQVEVSVSFVDKRGNPAAVEHVQWAVSDGSLLSVEQNATDPLRATVKAVGPLGSGQVSVTGDAQIGDGEALVPGTLDVQIVAGQATALSISTGTPTEQA